MTTTTVTGKRQITVPAAIARDMGIEVGTQLEWHEAPDKKSVVLTVRPGSRQLLERAQSIARKYKGPDSSQWLKKERERDEQVRGAALRVAEKPATYRARNRKSS